MARNIEIKARVSPGQLEHIRKVAVARSSREAETLHQIDTFYKCRNGRLKLRQLADGKAELIAYDRPDDAGPKVSSYVRSPCVDAESFHEVLARSVGCRGIIEKNRLLIHIGQARVHLDEVIGLGTFLEIEFVLRENQSPDEGQVIIEELLAAFGVPQESLIEAAYIDLIEDEELA